MKQNNGKAWIGLHLFLMVSSLFGIFSKLAGQEQFMSPRFLLYYSLVLLNLGVYALVWQQLIKKLPLVTAYANKAVGVIWGLLWGHIFFGDEITWQRLLGAAVVILGIVLVVTEKGEDND